LFNDELSLGALYLSEFVPRAVTTRSIQGRCKEKALLLK